jgi:hypothetical protein
VGAVISSQQSLSFQAFKDIDATLTSLDESVLASARRAVR